MSGIRSNIGLSSGIDTQALITALVAGQKAAIDRLNARAQSFKSTQTGVKTLEASVLSLASTFQTLKTASTFNAFKVTNSDTTQLTVTTNSSAASTATYKFQAIQTSSTHALMSRGYANANQQAIGTGTLTIATGGGLHEPTLLDALNGGAGISNGSIKITDRSGATATIDLSNAYTVDDVIGAINASGDIAITAEARGDHFILTDSSGGVGSLKVEEVGGGTTASDLGIKQTVAADRLTGSAVFEVTDGFTLDRINDGNGLSLQKTAPDISITFSDENEAALEINLDDVATLSDVIARINDHEDNDGRVSAALTNGRLVLTDLTTPGAGTFAVSDINGSSATRELGLDPAAAGGVITGKRLVAGMNSVLLRNLHGGEGIDVVGQISLTDRAGTTATIDLTGAESLDEVIAAINDAEDGGGNKLQLIARVNDVGTGILIEDTSGATASNLVVADVGGGTLATQLGIAVSAAQTSQNSGSLNHRYVGANTSLEKYAPSGGKIDPGSIKITDSAGNTAVIAISSAAKTVGDVMFRINSAADISVRAELNETGDGFVLIDEAAGAGTLKVEEVDGTTARDLRLLGDAEDVGGVQQISSRYTAVIDVESGDTLSDLVDKIKATAGFVSASVISDGSAFASSRLSLVSKQSGAAGKLIIDDSGLNLGLTTVTEGRDALLRVGDNARTGFLIASGDNSFTNAATGVDVDVLKTGDAPATVNVAPDTTKIKNAIGTFVTTYNALIDAGTELTKFDLEANTRGVLQGKGIVLRVQSRLEQLVNGSSFGSGDLQSLSALGVRVAAGGKLSIDSERLDARLAEDPAEVADFFLAENSGFAVRAVKTIESLTDSFTGTFALEDDALQASIDQLARRTEQLDSLLTSRRERLLLEFTRMEEILGALTSQQQAIGAISPLSIRPVGRGISA